MEDVDIFMVGFWLVVMFCGYKFSVVKIYCVLVIFYVVNFVLIFVEYYDLGIYYMEIFNGGIYKVLFLDWVNEEFVCLFMVLMCMK